jgi:Holliday junction DNA helicase RuvA
LIANITGSLFKKATESLIIEAGGIGYEVFVPLSTYYALPEKNDRVSLHIYTHVREDALCLFGFHTKLERNLFKMLISVSGIGPRLAVNILSGIGPEDLLKAIANGDAMRLRAIPGVGKKTAERIALELKDRAFQLAGDRQEYAPSAVAPGDKSINDDALSALVNLGYPLKSAKKALEKAQSSNAELTLEDLIKEALRTLA